MNVPRRKDCDYTIINTFRTIFQINPIQSQRTEGVQLSMTKPTINQHALRPNDAMSNMMMKYESVLTVMLNIIIMVCIIHVYIVKT